MKNTQEQAIESENKVRECVCVLGQALKLLSVFTNKVQVREIEVFTVSLSLDTFVVRLLSSSGLHGQMNWAVLKCD